MTETPDMLFLRIPLLMTKDENDFLIICKPLSIYIKSTSEKNAKRKFEESIDALFDKLIEKKIFMDYLNGKNLIISNDQFFRGGSNTINNNSLRVIHKMTNPAKPTIDVSDLTLGSHKRLDIPLQSL